MSKILVARTPRTDRSKAKEGADDCEAIVSVNLKLTDYNTNVQHVKKITEIKRSEASDHCIKVTANTGV